MISSESLPSGEALDLEQARERLHRWSQESKEVGVIYWSRSANFYARGLVEATTNGRVQMRGPVGRATFSLKGANFRYGPIPTWPKWPDPPVVEVQALIVQWENGDYLAIAEGLVGSPLSSPALPQ